MGTCASKTVREGDLKPHKTVPRILDEVGPAGLQAEKDRATSPGAEKRGGCSPSTSTCVVEPTTTPWHPLPRTCLRLQPWQPHTPSLVFAHGMILDNSCCSQPAVVMPTTSTQLMLTVASREDTAGALGVDSDSHYLKCLLDVSMASQAGVCPQLSVLGAALAAMVTQGHSGNIAADSLVVTCHKPWATRPHLKLRLHLHVLNAGASASEWVLCIDHELQGTTAIPPAIITQPPLLPLQPVPANPTPAQSTTPRDTQLIIKALLSRTPGSARPAPPSGVPSSAPGPSSTHSHLQRSAMMVSEAPWLVTLICLQDGVILSQNDASAHYLGRQLPCISRLDTAAGTTTPSPVAQAAGIHPAVQLLLSLLLVLEETSGEQEASQALNDIAQGRTWGKVVKVPLALADALREVCGMIDKGPEATSTQGPPAADTSASATAFPQPDLLATKSRCTTPPSFPLRRPGHDECWQGHAGERAVYYKEASTVDGAASETANVGGRTSALLSRVLYSGQTTPHSCAESSQAGSHGVNNRCGRPPSGSSCLRDGLAGEAGDVACGGEPASRRASVTWAQPQLLGLPIDRSSGSGARYCVRKQPSDSGGLPAGLIAYSQQWEASNLWVRTSPYTSESLSPSMAERTSGISGPLPSRGASSRSLRQASVGQFQRCSAASPRAKNVLKSQSFGAGQSPLALRQRSTGGQVHSPHASGRVVRILDTIARQRDGYSNLGFNSTPDAYTYDPVTSDGVSGLALDGSISDEDGASGLQQASRAVQLQHGKRGLLATEDPGSSRLVLSQALGRSGNTAAAGPALALTKMIQELEITREQKEGAAPAAAGVAVASSVPGGHASQDHEATATADVAVTAELLVEIKEQLQARPWCWHEVFLKRVVDPATGRPALLLVQSNVSERAELEAQLAELSEAQLGLLSQIFPRYVIEQLGVNGGLTVANLAQAARTHPCATVLFMDLVGFTRLSQSVSAENIIFFINDLFGTFDLLVDKHGVHKIDCMGDCLVIASGVLSPDDEGFNVVDEQHTPEECAARVFACAQDMIRVAAQVRLPHTGERLEIRIGIHSGTCVSGLIGLRLPKWTVLGDTVNTAARMEQTCVPGKVQVSTTTHALLSGLDEQLQPTGGVLCKGKGVMDTWIWAPPMEWENEPPLPEAFFEPSSPATSQDAHANGRRVQFDMLASDLLGCIPELLSTRNSTCTTTDGNAMAAVTSRFASGSNILAMLATVGNASGSGRSRASNHALRPQTLVTVASLDTVPARGFKAIGSRSARSGHPSGTALLGSGDDWSGYHTMGRSPKSGPLKPAHARAGDVVKVLTQARKGWGGSPTAELSPQDPPETAAVAPWEADNTSPSESRIVQS